MSLQLINEILETFSGDDVIDTSSDNLPNFEMEYRKLGGSGLMVSTLSFGFWCTFGSKSKDVIKCATMLNYCMDHGINLFDNAEQYGSTYNESEIVMGKALKLLSSKYPKKWRRSNFVICTKIFFGGDGVNELGLSYKHLYEGVNGSLRRLQLDYIDIILLHRPDPLTPSIKIAEIMNKLVNEDMIVNYWGTSQISAALYTELYYICKINKYTPPIMDQCQYNMFERKKIELEYLRLFKPPYNIGAMTYSPLNTGILTGKYNKSIPSESRLSMGGKYDFLKKRWLNTKEWKLPIIEKLMEFVNKRFDGKVSIATLAIAWCIKNKNVSSVILGATKVYQLKENLTAINVAKELTVNDMEYIESVLNNKPKLPPVFRE